MLVEPDQKEIIMWKLVLGAVLALSLIPAGLAGAATVDVSITKTAYVPATASASTADTVKFTNNDTAAHAVTFKSSTGVSCSPTPFTLQPGQSGTCSLTAPGTYAFGDPSASALQGSLTITAPAVPVTLSLFAQPDEAVYASKVTLTGELSTRKAGENIVVLAAPCGRSEATKAATMQTASGGEYTIGLRPGRNTVYTVQAGATKSDPISVNVRPRVRLGRVGAHHYSLRVFAAVKFAGRLATIQRYEAARARWVFVKRVRLHANSTSILPTVVSSVAFRSSVPPHARLRALLPQSQVGSCYLAGTSNLIRG
jgi:plastocyanin